MILSVALPVLVMVTVWGELTVPTFWFEKFRLVGETVTAVASVTPEPVKVIVWGLSDALSVMVISSVSDPTVDGVKVMLRVQAPAPAARVPTQLSVSAKSVLDDVICEIVRGWLPALMTLTVRTGLLTPRVWFPKFMVAGTIAIPGELVGSTLATKVLPGTPAKFP